MPFTFHPANHKASRIPQFKAHYAETAKELLSGCSYQEHQNCEFIIQSSFSDSDLSHRSVWTSNNGFIRAAIEAYNHHHNLIIRPDDVWLAILTQFNLYVNSHAEELRHHFVAHDGQKELEVYAVGSTATYDWAQFPLETSKLIDENVTDPELRS